MVRCISELPMSLSLSVARASLVAGLLILGLAACGRRGALEAPPDPAVAKTSSQPTAASAAQQAAGPGQTDDEEAENTLPSPVGTPRRSNAKRGYVIPKEPFILDPLL
jgi:predicted small lipoprotein YifL